MTKRCCICGREFEPIRNKKITCGSAECMEKHRKEYMKAYAPKYRAANKAKVNENNSAYMRRRRERERQKMESQKEPDTLVGLDYAERQKAKTLEMAGRVQI